MSSTGYQLPEVENKRRNRRGKLANDGEAVSGVEWDAGGRLPYLPSIIKLGEEIELVVSGLPPSRITEAYHLICQAAERGDNIGVDEFPDEESLREMLELSDAYIGQDPATGQMKLLLIIEPSNHCRSDYPLYADAYIIMDKSLHEQEIYRAIIRLSVQFISDLGYEGVLANTFSVHTASIVALREEGFLVVGTIPWSGFVAKKGWSEGVVLFKDLTVGSIKRTPCMKAARNQVQVILNPTSAVTIVPPTQVQKHGRAIHEGSDKKDENFEMTKINSNKKDSGELINGRPKLAYLPVTYQFGGRKVTVDYIANDEVEDVYKLYQMAAKSGQGFGEDEFDGLDGFRKIFVENGHAVLARCIETGVILATLSVSPTAYCRTSNPVVADAYVLVNPNIRGKGIGLETTKIVLRVMKDLGYKGAVADTFVINKAMYTIMQRLGFNTVAYVPKGAHVKGIGWTDMVIQYKNLQENDECYAKFRPSKL